MSTLSSVEEFLDTNLLNSILNVPLLKTSNAEGTCGRNKFVTVPQIGTSGVPQVRVGVVGHAIQLVGNHMHFRAIQEYLYT